MADKKRYTVVQGDENGEIWIENVLCRVGDTVLLTDGEAAYRIGLSIEPLDKPAVTGLPGEHREAHIEVDESSRPFNPNTAPEEVERAPLRPERSATAKEVGAAAAVKQAG